MKFLWGEEYKDKRRQVKLDCFSKLSFLGYILKNSTHSHFGAWSFLSVHIRITPSEGPKGFVNWVFKKLYHGS